MEILRTATLMAGQTKKILQPNMHVPDVEGAIFIKLPWSDIRDTNVESQPHIHVQCVEENLREEMFLKVIWKNVQTNPRKHSRPSNKPRRKQQFKQQ